MKNKSASLQLSTNTIVLMVLALALIAIVLGSFTGLFSSSKDKLLDSILLVDSSIKATSFDVIAGADAFTLKRNKQQVITASFYNNGHSQCARSAEVIFYCPSGVYHTYDSLKLSVPIGQEKTLGGIIKFSPTVPRRDYICMIRARCGSDEVIVAEQLVVLKVN